MAYDEELARRIRELVDQEPGLTEQEMFGGLAFLIGGNMAVAASGQGGLLVRVDPAESNELVAQTGAQPMEMRGRPWPAGCASTPRMSRAVTSRPSGSDAARPTPARSPRRAGALLDHFRGLRRSIP
jgi:hypothetical protein